MPRLQPQVSLDESSSVSCRQVVSFYQGLNALVLPAAISEAIISGVKHLTSTYTVNLTKLIALSGHENFEESTEELAPLTAEEKATKLAEMRAAAAEKKAKQAIIDKEEARANDKIRAKSQKDLESIKDDMEKKERVKEAAAKKQDKVNEAAAKKRALAKIQADKDARRLKAEKEKAEREGRAPPAEVAAPIAAPAAARATPTQARLRLQTAAGTLTKTYPVETTLFELAHALAIEVGGEVTSFTMTYPKKTFDSVDFGLTLQEAGLVPSAVLIVK